jgi:hypothetical protein
MPSDMTGLNSERLTLVLQEAMQKKVMQSQTIMFSLGLDGTAALYDFCNIIAEAVSEEVIKEITMHSKLEAMSRDAGIAGSGIITGSVS